MSSKVFEGEDIAFNGLEVCSYRYLQGMAKSMNLPSNVKKIHLIEMIRAKKYCTETDLQTIINRVKMERKLNAQKKKKTKKKPFRVQGAEISSTSNSQSPPITLTPKRSCNFVIQNSPDIMQTLIKYQPMPNILRTETSILQPLKRHIESDRVLRSFNSVRRPNYRIMEHTDCMIGIVNDQDSMHEVQQERVKEIRQEAYQSVTFQKSPVMNALALKPDRQLVPISRSSNMSKPASRERKLSGIYPLQPPDKPTYEVVPTVGFRRTDGRLTKINAVIQKPLCNVLLPKTRNFVPKKQFITKQRATLTVQDMINYKVDHPNDLNTLGVGSSRLYNEIDRQIYSNYQLSEDRAIKQSQQVHSQLRVTHKKPDQICSISDITRTMKDPNHSRKVYKGCQRPKTNSSNKGWSYCVEYQGNGNSSNRKEWSIYDIDGQLLDNTVQRNEQNAKIHGSITIKETQPVPVSTNYKVTQGKITKPASRNYQVEYQTFNQEQTDRKIWARSAEDQHLNQEIAVRNIDDARSDEKSQFNEETPEKNLVYARTDIKNQQWNEEITARTIDRTKSDNQLTVNTMIYARSDIKDQRCNKETSARNMVHKNFITKNQHLPDKNMIYVRSDIKDHRCNQEIVKNIDHARGKNQRLNQETTENRVIYPKSDVKDQNYNLEPTTRNMGYYRCENTDTSSKYPNMASLTDVFPNEEYTQKPMEIGNDSSFTVYYHKKIRAEQIKSQKENERLPRINDAFSQFNDTQYRNLTQPLYVQVSAESDLVLPGLPLNGTNTCMLENIYNFKNQFVTNPPVLLIATTQTFCTYSTNTIPTAVAHPSTADLAEGNPYERANPYQNDDRLNNYLKPEYSRSFRCDEVLSSSTNSLETTNSQELGANITIPEMVEDALELISQDGDYMERIGMDVRIQCILCNWAGPKIILEFHIKKDHAQDIQQQTRSEWAVVFTLGELCAKPSWSSQLMQLGTCVYVVSGKYTDDDVILVALSMIPTDIEMDITKRGRITVYNKVSGRPYIYEGDITHLPDSMPYEYGLDCLSLDVGNLDLIPNSANLRFVNRELVGSNGKAVIGQPELDKIEIIIYIKLLD